MKFLSCNIEGNKHYELIFPLLKAEKPDIVAFQEVFEADLAEIQVATGLNKCLFCPMLDFSGDEIYPGISNHGVWGLAIFANELEEVGHYYYSQVIDESNPGRSKYEHRDDKFWCDRVMLVARASVNGDDFVIGETHFTWSGKGEVTDEQREDYSSLKAYLDKYDEMIFCGDLNTARGREIWTDLEKKFVDNIPPEIDTTVDNKLHKAEVYIRLVVDSLFTTKHYQASEVRVLEGVSDHKAILAEISRS